MIKGANLVVQTLHGLEAGTLEPKSQAYEGTLKDAPKLHQENTRIDWRRSAEEIRNLIRGLNPFPGAWTEISFEDKKERVKILSALISGSGGLKSGELRLEKSSVFIGTGSSDLQIVEWQWPGKRKMSAEEFLRGFNFRGEMRAR
jgi:methionyl-tRNA formyltransferase